MLKLLHGLSGNPNEDILSGDCEGVELSPWVECGEDLAKMADVKTASNTDTVGGLDNVGAYGGVGDDCVAPEDSVEENDVPGAEDEQSSRVERMPKLADVDTGRVIDDPEACSGE